MKTLKPAVLGGGRIALRDDRAYSGLNPQQWQFAEHRVKGMSVTEAYRAVYQPDENADRDKVNALAAKIEGNLKVQARIRTRLAEIHGAGADTLPVIGKDFVLTGIATLAVSGEKEATRLRGYELLGKALGLFDRGPETIEAPKTVSDVDARLRDLLRSSLGAGPVIDGEVIDEAPPLGPDAPLSTPAGQGRKRKPRPAPDGEGPDENE